MSLTKKEYICEVCSTKFLREPCYINRSIRNGCIITCKRGCSNRIFKKLAIKDKNPAWKGGVTSLRIKCPTCLSIFLGRPEDIYCSINCYGKAQKIGSTNFRGRNERNFPKYRRLAEKSLGRPLIKGEVVHHIDGDYKNNNIDNLVVMSHSDHTRLHTNERVVLRKKFEERGGLQYE